jgi:DNA-binding transcriptional ArsR family regulator
VSLPSRPRKDLETITDPVAAGALLRPLRLALLALAREPASATELARRLGLPRQRVHYHVRALEKAGFLRPAGRLRKRNLVEQRFVATAGAYVLLPEVLGPLAADWRAVADTTSADYVLALAEQVRADVAGASRQASIAGETAETFSVKSQFRFDSPRQRTEFAAAVRQALVEAIARHTTPDRPGAGRSPRGRVHRLVLSCYPAPSAAREGQNVPNGGGA